MAETTTGAAKRAVHRSPSYPGIDLKEALDKAQQLYDKEKERWAYVETIAKLWGYENSKSGNFAVAIAALIKYGLLEDEGVGGQRRARLTNSAVKILVDKRDTSQEREQAIQKAALNPSIHRELWVEYNGFLPNPDDLRYHLRTKKGFSDRGVNEFVPQFERTVKFAKLDQSDTIALSEEAITEDESHQMTTPQLTAQAAVPSVSGPGASLNNVTLPLFGGFATLSAQFPMSEKNWNQMLNVLSAMKPSLISGPSNEESN